MDANDVTYFESPSAFRDWLENYHAERDELWVGYWKKGTGRPSLTWEESVDEALCFGWIDGIRKRLDEEAYTIRFTPRRSGSHWSRRNIERYASLDEAARVEPAGRAAFEKWREANAGTNPLGQETPSTLPDDYLARLKAHEDAWSDWQSRPPGYRRQVTHWVMSAQRESTRERRLRALIEDCAAGRKVKPFRL